VSAQTALPSPSNVGDQKWEIATLNTTFGLQADYGSISTCVIDSSCGIFEVESGQISDNPGKWTVAPVPPALWLFGSGMLGLIVIARRRKRLDGMSSDGGLGGRVLLLRKIWLSPDGALQRKDLLADAADFNTESWR
jgi:hypothetical protein